MLAQAQVASNNDRPIHACKTAAVTHKKTGCMATQFRRGTAWPLALKCPRTSVCPGNPQLARQRSTRQGGQHRITKMQIRANTAKQLVQAQRSSTERDTTITNQEPPSGYIASSSCYVLQPESCLVFLGRPSAEILQHSDRQWTGAGLEVWGSMETHVYGQPKDSTSRKDQHIY